MDLLKEFNIQKQQKQQPILNDYDIFPDKKLLEDLRLRIVQSLVDMQIPKEQITSELIDSQIDLLIEGFDLTTIQRNHLYNLINDEINGYGPLNNLIKDENITEIMVNSPQEVYIEIDGKIIKDESVSFIDNEHIIRTLKNLIEESGKQIDLNNYIVNFRLNNKARVSAVIPPLSLSGPVLNIHKYNKTMTSIDDLIRVGALTPYMARFLSAAVEGKLNILVSGTSSSGKTTLLNILGDFISENERIITIEDDAEINLKQKNVVSFENNISFNKEEENSTKALIASALKMRPDRIIFGQINTNNAFDILQVMNNNDEGVISAIYASSPNDAINYLETLVLCANANISSKYLRKYIASAIDLIVQIDRLADGRRKITNICEVQTNSKDEIILKDIFTFAKKISGGSKINGEFTLIEDKPKVMQKINDKAIHYVDDMFKETSKKSSVSLNELPKLKQ